MKICTIEGCFNKAVGRGWCHKHYKRWQTHGDPEKVVNKRIHGMSIKERILDTVKIDDVTGCWNWTGSVSKRNGRGRLKVNCKTTVAYRASYEVFIGEIPDGLFVCHKCDNPLCVNPDHLFIGSSKDNMSDAVLKGRNARHENHSNSKLSYMAVNDIRTKLESAKYYAKKYKVHVSTIYRVWRGGSWVDKSLSQNANSRKEMNHYGA